MSISRPLLHTYIHLYMYRGHFEHFGQQSRHHPIYISTDFDITIAHMIEMHTVISINTHVLLTGDTI